MTVVTELDTNPTQSKQKQFVIFNNRDNLLFTRRSKCGATKDVGTLFLELTRWIRHPPKKLIFFIIIIINLFALARSVIILSLNKAVTFKVTLNFPAAQALNLWMLLTSPNTIRQLSFICAIRPVSASVKASLPNSHTAMNDTPLCL